MNLSLIIDDVRRGDSIQDYHCILEVFNPTSGSSIDEYAVASNVSISLTALCKLSQYMYSMWMLLYRPTELSIVLYYSASMHA